MSLQWTLVATFLYVEIGFIILLLLPFISPTRWQKIFKSRLVTALTSYASLYFNVILVALVLLLLDAIREISKYKTRIHSGNEHHPTHYGPTMELVKEFRAQRNFYIAGTALFLWFVIKRILALTTQTAILIIDNETIKKQAESTRRTAESLMESAAKQAKQEEKSKEKPQENTEAVKDLEEKLEKATKDLKAASANLDAMKRQAESVSREYDNLLKEHAKVTARLEKYENEGESKKTN